MDFDDDIHLCIKCGQTVNGLSNYISHRRQNCHKFHQPFLSPFLSANFTSPEPPVEELQSVSPQDILSADDFFSCLNLQSTLKSSVDNKSQNISSDAFCSRLDDPVGEHSLVSDLYSSAIQVEPAIIGIDNVLPDEKLDDLKYPDNELNNQLIKGSCSESCEPPVQFPSDNSLSATGSLDRKSRKSKKKINKYVFTDFSKLHVPRTSYRQKLNANDSLVCCVRNDKYFSCIFCNSKYAFAATFLDHLLVCGQKSCDNSQWKEEIFKNESLLVRSSHFRCLLCSFFCGDSFSFLNHLKSPSHRQNAASLKIPLICLPCQDECSASDEMKDHFSKNHLQYRKEDHPIIIAKKLRNLHCCHCLTIVKSSSLLNTNSENRLALVEQDSEYMKENLPIVSECGYGVEKNMLSSCVNNFTQIISDEDSADTCNSVNDVESPELEKEPEIKDQSYREKHSPTLSETMSITEYIITNIQSDDKHIPKISLKKLGAKLSLQNAKLILKRSKKGNFRKKWFCNVCRSHHLSKMSLKQHLDGCCNVNVKDGSTLSISSKGNENKNSSVVQQKYLCDQCVYVGKSFNQLTRHSRSHTGVKPFHCDQCNYSCSLSSQIIRHKRVHTGQKPYKCPHCSYACNTQENLRKHILKTKKHKGKRMYPCNHCDYESNDYSKFQYHLSRSHSKHYPSDNTNSSFDCELITIE